MYRIAAGHTQQTKHSLRFLKWLLKILSNLPQSDIEMLLIIGQSELKTTGSRWRSLNAILSVHQILVLVGLCQRIVVVRQCHVKSSLSREKKTKWSRWRLLCVNGHQTRTSSTESGCYWYLSAATKTTLSCSSLLTDMYIRTCSSLCDNMCPVSAVSHDYLCVSLCRPLHSLQQQSTWDETSARAGLLCFNGGPPRPILSMRLSSMSLQCLPSLVNPSCWSSIPSEKSDNHTSIYFSC